MSSAIHRLAFVLLGGTALLASAPGSPEEPSFSRRRWLQERRGTYLSPEGWQRAEPLPAEALRAPAVLPQRPRPAGPAWTRVSRDILASDASRAQPETQAEPFLAVDPEQDWRLLAGYQEARYDDGGARALAYAWSKDSGRTWTEGLVPGLTHASGGSFERASDPWVAFGPGGRAYYCSLLFNESRAENGIYVSASRDGGRSWGPPVAVHTGDVDDFDDKQAMVVDTYADSPYRGRIYVGWGTIGRNYQILRTSWSGDGGASFSPAVDVAPNGMNLGVIPLVAPGGVVHVVWTHADAFRLPFLIQHSRSEDGGATWSPPVVVAQMQPSVVGYLRTGYMLPAAAVDPRTGRLYVVWMDRRFTTGKAQVALSRSDDGGRTWSAPQRVSDGPADAPAFTPSVAVSGEGRVAVSYYSLRNDPDRKFLADLYAALSKDGVSFGASRRLSPSSWDVRFAAFAHQFFLGDYQGLAAGRKHFHALWIATPERSRLDAVERQPDAFASRIRP